MPAGTDCVAGNRPVVTRDKKASVFARSYCPRVQQVIDADTVRGLEDTWPFADIGYNLVSSAKGPIMSAMTAIKTDAAERRMVADIARELGPIFSERANEATDEDKFVADNYAVLKSSG